jgi:hypothetical protein
MHRLRRENAKIAHATCVCETSPDPIDVLVSCELCRAKYHGADNLTHLNVIVTCPREEPTLSCVLFL